VVVLLMRLSVSIPSMPGILMSIKMASKEPPFTISAPVDGNTRRRTGMTKAEAHPPPNRKRVVFWFIINR
jgi:hypothetical protein